MKTLGGEGRRKQRQHTKKKKNPKPCLCTFKKIPLDSDENKRTTSKTRAKDDSTLVLT